MGEAVGEDHAARLQNWQGETTLPANVNAKEAGASEGMDDFKGHH